MIVYELDMHELVVILVFCDISLLALDLLTQTLVAN